MFDQFVMNLKQEQSVVQAVVAPSRAPIEKLLQHRAYPFVGTIEVKPKEAEYWLEHITQIVTKQLSCSDEHKLECAVAFLIDEALSWWETTTLTVLQRRSPGSSLWWNSRRSISVNNTSKKEEGSSCTPSKVENLLVISIDDDRPQWQSKKAIYHHENPITYTPVSRSNFTPRPPTRIELAIPKVSMSSERNLEKTLPCKFCQKWHWSLSQISASLVSSIGTQIQHWNLGIGTC
ncbi:hypothetical protein GQ457_16G022080 [Hibiscus cannabinus]